MNLINRTKTETKTVFLTKPDWTCSCDHLPKCPSCPLQVMLLLSLCLLTLKSFALCVWPQDWYRPDKNKPANDELLRIELDKHDEDPSCQVACGGLV